jgi:Zn finger protein HypA/HybF involved in hydrogenase expression
MNRFLVEIRIDPEQPECPNCGAEAQLTGNETEPFVCAHCGTTCARAGLVGEHPEPDADELISVLANSTAAEALADGLRSRIEMTLVERPPNIVVWTAGGVVRDARLFQDGVPAACTTQVHDRDHAAEAGQVDCPKCDGSGLDEVLLCPRCGGSGTVHAEDAEEFEHDQQARGREGGG